METEDQSKSSQSTLKKIPNHIAIIMDGNGRWAKQRGLPRLAGHQAGTKNLQRVIHACVEYGIHYLTIYAFSTENWGRPSDEVNGLMSILADFIDNELEELNKDGVKLVHLGLLEKLDPTLCAKITRAIEMTKNNSKFNLCIALNYGGRDEIVYALRKLIQEGITADQITDDIIAQHLFTAGIPDPDLVIRTSGEMRISNFLIWQSAYSEWYFTPTYWPDFDREELYKALMDYELRDRRYGKLSNCDEDNSGDAE
ncbi:MAG: isoprenyl transferase [Anaerolineaceae bacterium]